MAVKLAVGSAVGSQAVQLAVQSSAYSHGDQVVERVRVTSAARAYSVVIGDDAIEGLGRELDAAKLGARRILVSSQRVWDFHGRLFKKLGADRTPILIEDGERYKNLNTVARILDALVKAQADRSTVLIAVGGGVIGDMVGFAAATYLRGIPIVHVPTTLLAQVDSAIGGKTGVNHPLGKNLIGSFHAPSLVVADPIVLQTLPRREFRAGLYEVIKYGVISDPTLLDRMRDSTTAIFNRDGAAIAPLVSASCRIKAEVVSADERESGSAPDPQFRPHGRPRARVGDQVQADSATARRSATACWRPWRSASRGASPRSRCLPKWRR